MSRPLFLLALGGAVVAATGCSRTDATLSEVTGQVTFNGLPATAEIVFQPDSIGSDTRGRPSTAFTDSEGKFTLAFSADKSGAVVGQHAVSIKILSSPNASSAGSKPRTYDEAVSPVKIARFVRRVRPGRNQFHFPITY